MFRSVLASSATRITIEELRHYIKEGSSDFAKQSPDSMVTAAFSPAIAPMSMATVDGEGMATLGRAPRSRSKTTEV